MRIAMYEYIEINLVGVVLLLTMLFYMHKTRDNEQNNENRYFKGMVIINALILLADNGIYLMRGHDSLTYPGCSALDVYRRGDESDNNKDI